MNPRIIPLNLPAGLAREIDGNPATARPESMVANCFPGLEVDVKNLDRRFFPGLVFEFVFCDEAAPGALLRGAMLVAADPNETGVPAGLQKDILELSELLSAGKKIFIGGLAAEGGPLIDLSKPDGLPFDADVAWRLVRMLDAGEVTVHLEQRDGGQRQPLIDLTAQRRAFVNKWGELSSAFQPGELTQSLCSPWQHDFRDCACTYWASNHPDIVLPAHPSTIAEIHDPGTAEDRAEDPVIWLRWDQSKNVPALEARDSSRAFEMDHYEINERWKDLPFVLAGRELHVPWSIGPVEEAVPLSDDLIVAELGRLAGMEQALALEYLFARYSVRFEDPALPGEAQEHADFIAHELLTIATSEMTHIRWSNQLRREIGSLRGTDVPPALAVAKEVPGALDAKTLRPIPGTRPPALRTIDKAIPYFIAAEAPSGTLEGQYAKVLATLRKGIAKGGPNETRGLGEYPPDLIGLAERIIADGVTHYSRFREIEALLKRPRKDSLVRTLVKKVTRKDFDLFVDMYSRLLANLATAYTSGRAEDRIHVIRARNIMIEIDSKATALARNNVGVPLLDIAHAAGALLSAGSLPGSRRRSPRPSAGRRW